MPLPSCRLCAHVTKEPPSIAGYSGFSKEVGNLYFGVKSSNQKLLTHHFKGQQTINKTHLCAGSMWLLILPEATLPHFPLVKCKHLSAWRERDWKKSFCLSEKGKDGWSFNGNRNSREKGTQSLKQSHVEISDLPPCSWFWAQSSLPCWVGFPRKLAWICDLCVGGMRGSALGSTGAGGRQLGWAEDTVTPAAWVDHTRSSGQGMVLEKCPQLTQGAQAFTLLH